MTWSAPLRSVLLYSPCGALRCWEGTVLYVANKPPPSTLVTGLAGETRQHPSSLDLALLPNHNSPSYGVQDDPISKTRPRLPLLRDVPVSLSTLLPPVATTNCIEFGPSHSLSSVLLEALRRIAPPLFPQNPPQHNDAPSATMDQPASQQKLPAGLADVLNHPEELRDSAYFSAQDPSSKRTFIN